MRLLEIDASNRWQHKRLDDGDSCYHLFEYTSHHGGDARTNQLIRNLKKKPSLKDKPGYIYKERAIEHWRGRVQVLGSGGANQPCAQAEAAAASPSSLIDHNARL